MPKWLVSVVIVAGALALVPVVLLVRARLTTSEKPRIHPIQNMDNQQRFKAQQSNPMFADGRAMRPPVEGAVARGDLADDPAYYRGVTADDWPEGQEPPWVTQIPVEVTEAVLRRGQQRYDAFCATCHGLTGAGDGSTSARALELMEDGKAAWVPPTPLTGKLVASRPPGHLFNTITNGLRTMPAYATQIPVEDRWAIVAYLQALQRSQNATLGDVPADEKDKLK